MKGKAQKAAVFLDRDGVLVRSEVRNGKSYAPRRLEDFRLLPGVVEAVRRLHEAGFVVVVVTNQPDIGNGLVDLAVIEAMHDRLLKRLAVDAIEMCPHRQDEGCKCRKPRPGMLQAAAKRYSIDFTKSFMVGDRESDVIAGRKVGCYTVFINRGYDPCKQVKPDLVVRSLPQAVDRILSIAGLGQP